MSGEHPMVRGLIQKGVVGLQNPSSKLQASIDFLRNSCTDPLGEAIGPLGSNCLSKEVCTALCEICLKFSGSSHDG